MNPNTDPYTCLLHSVFPGDPAVSETFTGTIPEATHACATLTSNAGTNINQVPYGFAILPVGNGLFFCFVIDYAAADVECTQSNAGVYFPA